MRQKSGKEGDRVIDTIELPESDQQAYDLEAGEWITHEEKPNMEQLLSALLREQVKTNELLRQLVNTRKSAAPAKTYTKASKN